MNNKLNALIDSYRDEFTRMLARWVQIDSVKTDAAEGAPFGPGVARMLDVAADDIAAMGFPVRTFDGYALDATLGSTDREMVAVLGHLDVVPTGSGWRMPPFSAQIEGTRMYGRGTSDDKGPSLCALFAMKAIREAGLPLKRSVRLILGGDEESGWEDMAYYTAHTQMPAIGFSPDASFPLINTEKGMVHVIAKAPVSKEGLQVLEMYNGERLNVISGEATALVAGGAELAAKATKLASELKLDVTVTVEDAGVRLACHGIGGHSAYPFECRNAIGMLLVMLRGLGVEGAIRSVADAYPFEYDGKALGIDCSDEVSGSLTCNVGILHLENGWVTASFDCRCPVCADLDSILNKIKAALPGFTVMDSEVKPAHHVPADSELVTKLLAAYEEETGLKGEAMSTGGGTYAKVLQSGVAFGAIFPGEEELAHQPNEYVDLNNMMLATKVYANALVKLCVE